MQKKRKICEAVSKALSGVTEILGTFIQDLCAAEETAGASISRPKRRRVLKHDDEEESEDPDYKEDETEEESEDSYYSEEDGMEDNSDDGSTGPPLRMNLLV